MHRIFCDMSAEMDMDAKQSPRQPLKRKSPCKYFIYRDSCFSEVDPLGLEPRMTEPKSAVLPITPWVNHIPKRAVQIYNFFQSHHKFFVRKSLSGISRASPYSASL